MKEDRPHLCANGQDLHHFLRGVWQCPNNDEPIEEVHWHSMWRREVGAPDCANASVGGEYDNGSKGALEGTVEEGEAFNIEHVDLVDKEHPGDKLSHALIDIPVWVGLG